MKNTTIFDKNEVSYKKILDRMKIVINQKTGIINRVYVPYKYNDEPPLYKFTASICNTELFSSCGFKNEFLGGISLAKEKALIKTIGEAIERYCLSLYNVHMLVTSPYAKLKNNALNPTNVVGFSKKQLLKKEFKKCIYDERTKFKWALGYSLSKGRALFIPAQLIYVPYHFNDEPIIRFPITTGAAFSSSMSGALYRGICEVVERDAFMITYLNKISCPLVNIEGTKNKYLIKLFSTFKKYKLDLFVFDITTDIQIPVFLSVIIDRSGKGPAVTTGLKANLNPEEAIIGSIEEAQHTRPWLRKLKDINKRYSLKNLTLTTRGLYWYDIRMIYKLDFLLKTISTKKIDSIRDRSHNNSVVNLKKCIDILNKKKYEILFCDVTTCDIKELGFTVVKVVIPKLQPLYLEEKYKYMGGERLYDVPVMMRQPLRKETQLNKIPHPFL